MSKASNQKLEEVKNLFTIYLEKHKLRKTNERYIILEEIYKRDDHFDAESLYIYLNKKKMGISRATVYNTLDLLVSGELVRKHQFGENQNQYEKAYGYLQHDHLICIKCKNVIQGDKKSISIAAASIIAKEHRDNIMRKLSKFYPTYDWNNNMGYCSPETRRGIPY